MAAMTCDVDLDWCTYRCPCGASLCTRYVSDERFSAWMAEHKPHTDGTAEETVTDRGASVYSEKPAPRTVRL